MNATYKLLMAILAAVVISACASTPDEEEVAEEVSDSDASTVIVDDAAETIDEVIDVDPEASLVNVFYFDFDKSSLTYEARAALDAYAAVLRNNPRNIRLEGHADERGTREYNIALGERRAKSVADYLISSGVSASSIETVSYGEERPAVAGSGDSAWSQNRRVELK